MYRLLLSFSLVVSLITASTCDAQGFSGLWDAEIKCKGGPIRFGLDLAQNGNDWTAHLVNGPERIEVPLVRVDAASVTLEIDHYDSKVELKLDPKVTRERLIGTWTKRRGPAKWSTMKCSAVRHHNSKFESPDAFIGRWAVKFESNDDPAVGVFKKADDSGQLLGNFMTSTGDYRFLAGFAKGNTMELSCFDGAHAFLFRAKLHGSGSLAGDFWSSSTWHETWSATPDPNAKLKDDFKQTKIDKTVDLGALSFPDLDGNATKLNDPRFDGKARVIYVFGSWCPNCHDAGKYFASLEKKYASQGLSILGLAFELTGDFERDSEQVRTYLKRHGSNYPVLVAGLADKAEASKSLPLLDRVRSYPTTIFLDGNDNITDVHTGFTGPATGETFEKLKQKFEAIIQKNLGEQ